MDASSLFLIQYLRSEAEMSEEKARRLRAQAAQLAEEFGSDLPGHYELGVAELPPLDENGVPKYKGRKRGRKKKQRKRVHDPNKPKRAHTGYTFYIQETYPGLKQQYLVTNPTVKSNEIIAMVAAQWKEMSAEEKAEWKQRALASSAIEEAQEEMEGEEEEEEEDTEDEDENVGGKKRGRPKKG